MTREQLAERFRRALDDRDKTRRRMPFRSEPNATHTCLQQLLQDADAYAQAVAANTIAALEAKRAAVAAPPIQRARTAAAPPKRKTAK